VLRDAILAVACIYAAVDAINALSSGGQDVEYDLAALWAGILCVIGLAMTLFLRGGRGCFSRPCSKSMRGVGWSAPA
jgi:predicted Co/Zn/Cd cation transporter (cation efflux family)